VRVAEGKTKPVVLDKTSLKAGFESRIHLLRGVRVLLSHDLAELYGIETKVLHQSVRRHLDRFPDDFQFTLTNQEFALLRSQIVTSRDASSSWGGARYAPMAFTEQGVAMLSSVLRSPEAVAVNIQIMRTFVRMRGIFAEHEDLKRQLAALERKYDGHFRQVFDAIKDLMTPPEPPKKRPIGFIHNK
jgi:hypothetical protein